MDDNPLKIVSTSDKKEGWVSSKSNNRTEAIARFDRLWLQNPEQFNPERNCMEQERIERTAALFPELNGCVAADLGCGLGTLSRLMRDAGATVTAVDVSANALKALKEWDATRISAEQDYVPRTKLIDDSYDLALGTELVAYLPHQEYRLFMSELARLVKPDGNVICSTPIDINSVDSLERFIELSETEFKPTTWKLSYHKYWIKLHDFIAAPSRYVRAGRDAQYRTEKLEEREGFGKVWFRWNSSKPLVFLWMVIRLVSAPLHSVVKRSRWLLLTLERMCKAISSTAGISHAIWIGKRRPLVEYTPPEEQPEVHLGKKQVWE